MLSYIELSFTLVFLQHTYNKMISMGSIGLTLHRPQVIALDWTQPCEALNGCTFDIILLTDCIFSVTLTDALIGTILRYCTNKTEILCCHEIRDEVSTYMYIYVNVYMCICTYHLL